MYKVWLERVDQEPTLLSSARKHGLTRLGYMSLKPEQLSAIDAILRGRDTFVSVPTGFGKSLVYQVLPFCADWLTGRVTGISTSSKPVVMVVSPLLSLMHDQVAKLASKNILAICISGKQQDVDQTLKEVVEGSITHIYGSPEAFIGNEKWRSRFVYAWTALSRITRVCTLQPPTVHEY